MTEPRAVTAPAGVAGRRFVDEKPRMADPEPRAEWPPAAMVTVPSVVDARGPPTCQQKGKGKGKGKGACSALGI